MKKWTLRVLLLLIGILLLSLLVVIAGYLYLSTRTNGEVTSLGEERKYLLYVPETYNSDSPVPLVISLHGAFLYPGFQMRLSQWNDLADKEGFIVVYPKAAGLPSLWRMTPGDDLAMETQFLSDLIDKLSVDYNIDSKRVYANGFSNGAAMTVMLSCSLSNRIAAFGMVATPVVPWDWCGNPAPAPVIAIHGTDDPFALYNGGENFLTTEPLPTIQEWTSMWAERNMCDAAPIVDEIATQVAVTRYENCVKGATVALYSVREAGHVWPGGMKFPGNSAGPNSDSINATQQMWQFFKNHPLTP